MKVKLLRGLLISTFLMLLLSTGASAADVANSDFTNVLVVQLSLDSERPGNYDTLAISEQFSIDSNILASKGVTAFVGEGYADVVSSGEAADVMYMLMTVPAPDATQTEKLNYLVQKGIMTSTQPEITFTTDEMDAVFANTYVTERLSLSEDFVTYVPSKEQLLNPGSPTGIDQSVILVEPDITDPYTERASPTI